MEIPDTNLFSKISMFVLYKKYPTEKFFTFLDEGDIDLQHPNQLGNAYIAKVILKEVFNVEFDPDKYIYDTLSGVKHPGY